MDQGLLGAPDIVFVMISMEVHAGTIPEDFVEKLEKFPEVLEIYLTTGSSDYLVKVAVNGTRGFEDFVRRKLHQLEGVRHSRSGFSLQCLKQVESYLPD